MSSNRLRTMVRCVLKSSALSIVALSACEISLALYTSDASAAEVAFRKIDFDIAAQAVESALNEFSRQADMQVMVDSTAVAGQKTKGIKGKRDVLSALEELLRGTGLKAEATGHTVTIRAVAVTTASDTVVRPIAAEEFVKVSEQGQGVAQSVDRKVESNELDVADEVTVTGSRLKRAAKDEGPAPVSIFNREHIERLGVSNVADVLNFLPQQSFSVVEGLAFSGARTARLRGLGVGNTIVLIDGRRTVTSALQASGNVFDLNTVPLSAVERVEVLSDSASAIYGADAVGGVVNIILRKNVATPQVDFSYGAARDGADERRASLSFGIGGDRIRMSVAADYFNRDFLLGRDRDFYSNGDFTRLGGTDTRSILSNPGNITSLTAANLPGLTSRTAAVPIGSSGVGLTPASFAATAGRTNLESLGKFRSVVPEAERYSGLSSVEFDITSNLSAFADVLYTHREETSVTVPGILISQTVPATNAFNPFGTAVAVTYLFEGMGQERLPALSELTRATGGLRGQLGDWSWEVSALSTYERAKSATENDIDMSKVVAALASSDPSQALNVFQDGPGGSPALLASLAASPVILRYKSRATQGGGFIGGPIFNLPAGSTDAVMGGEVRSEKLYFANGRVDADRKSYAAYSELRVPVISPSMHVAAVDDLTVTAAVRYDHYDDFGGSTNPQLGVQWHPIQSLLVRGSIGTSFRAPSLYELFLPRATNPGLIADPRRGNTQTPITTTSGGNDDLHTEEADSFTAGLVFSPKGTEFRIAATYWDIHQEERAERFTPALVLANETLFPERVVRAAPTQADTAAGRPGQLLSLNTTAINFGRLDTSGIDFGISHSWTFGFGRVSPELQATWVRKYEVVDFPNTVAVNRVGVANSQGTIPEYRASGGIGWELGGFEVRATSRFTTSYADVNNAGARTGRRVPSITYFDLQASIDLHDILTGNDSWSSGLVFRVGATNLFDKGPDYSAVSGLGFDSSQVDNRQRFGYASISKKF